MVEIKGKDGRAYQIEVRVGILEVKETEMSNPATGEPGFEILFNVNISQSAIGAPK